MQVCKWWKFRKTFTFKLKPLKGHKMTKFIVQFGECSTHLLFRVIGKQQFRCLDKTD